MGLLAPTALLFSGLLVPVVLMYFIRQRRDPVVFPTIALWARLVREELEARRFKRFRNSLLLWLQLALMLLLIAALARPFRRGTVVSGQVTALIVDCSASMQADGGDGTRFAAAKAEIREFLGRVGAGDRVVLIAAGPRPWVAHPLTEDRATVERALAALRCTDGAGTLAPALRVAAQAAGLTAAPVIHVWTDGAGAALDGVERLQFPVQWHAVGELAANAGITAFAARRLPQDPRHVEIFAGVANFGDAPRELALRIALGDTLLSYTTHMVAPGATAHVVTERIPATSAGIVTAQLESEDALAADNVARLVLAGQATTRVVLVSEAGALLERVLALVPGVEVIQIGPDALFRWAETADLIVLDGWLPAVWPTAPTLVFNPPAGSGALGETRVVHAPVITTWRRDHPLLERLTLADVAIRRGLTRAEGPGVTSLAASSEGPVVWLQREGIGRQIVVGFPLQESDWLLKPSFPLFLAKVVDSVRESRGLGVATGGRVGETLRVPARTAEATVVYPDGREASLHPVEDAFVVDDTRRAGVYLVRGAGWVERRAVNLLDARESNLPPQPLPAPQVGDARVAAIGLTREYWPWLIAVAVVLSLLEWAAFHRRGI